MAVVRRVTAVVEKVDRYPENVCCYELRAEKRLPTFKPGQFLHLTLEPYDPSAEWPESRVFSIASAPARR